MKQAVLIDQADLQALVKGIPMTINVDGHEVIVMRNPLPMFLPMPSKRKRSSPQATRRIWSDARKRAVLAAYSALPKYSGQRSAYLRKHRISSGMLFNWKTWEVKSKVQPAKKGR
jgi:hypothetical protein